MHADATETDAGNFCNAGSSLDELREAFFLCVFRSCGRPPLPMCRVWPVTGSRPYPYQQRWRKASASQSSWWIIGAYMTYHMQAWHAVRVMIINLTLCRTIPSLGQHFILLFVLTSNTNLLPTTTLPRIAPSFDPGRHARRLRAISEADNDSSRQTIQWRPHINIPTISENSRNVLNTWRA